MEPARIASTVIWVFALTLYAYYQYYSLSTFCKGLSLLLVSSIARIMTPLWYASYFHALALALAIYLASHIYRTRKETVLNVGLRRSGRTQVVATLCLGICAYLIFNRLAPFQSMMYSGMDQISPILMDYKYGPDSGWYGYDQFQNFAWLGMLTTLIVLVRGYGLLPLLDVSRKSFMAVGIVLAVIGVLVPFAVLNGILPAFNRTALERLNSENLWEKAIIFGDEDFIDDGRIHLARYLETHNDDGVVIPQLDVDRNEMPIRGQIEYYDQGPQLCELCQIPGLPYWTTNGIPLMLSNEFPPAGNPDLVLELPRAGWYCRYYEPVLEAKIIRAPLGNLAEVVDGKTWIILKIDLTNQGRASY